MLAVCCRLRAVCRTWTLVVLLLSSSSAGEDSRLLNRADIFVIAPIRIDSLPRLGHSYAGLSRPCFGTSVSGSGEPISVCIPLGVSLACSHRHLLASVWLSPPIVLGIWLIRVRYFRFRCRLHNLESRCCEACDGSNLTPWHDRFIVSRRVCEHFAAIVSRFLLWVFFFLHT